jgi:alpha-glucosidase
MLVGEVFLLDTSQVAAYYGQGDELHLAFNFPPLFAPWEASAWRDQIARAEAEFGPRGAWPTWVLSNHDNVRHGTRYGSESRARAAAVLLLTLRGTPFLYAGEELGLEDALIPPERVIDPGGRDGCRAPLPWDATPAHGWTTTDPWLPWPPDPQTNNVEGERLDASSILHLYRRLLTARRASPALTAGAIELLAAPAGVLAYERRHAGDRRVVAINFSDRALDFNPDSSPGTSWRVEVASDGLGEGEPYAGALGGSTAVLLAPEATLKAPGEPRA